MFIAFALFHQKKIIEKVKLPEFLRLPSRYIPRTVTQRENKYPLCLLFKRDECLMFMFCVTAIMK